MEAFLYDVEEGFFQKESWNWEHYACRYSIAGNVGEEEVMRLGQT